MYFNYGKEFIVRMKKDFTMNIQTNKNTIKEAIKTFFWFSFLVIILALLLRSLVIGIAGIIVFALISLCVYLGNSWKLYIDNNNLKIHYQLENYNIKIADVLNIIKFGISNDFEPGQIYSVTGIRDFYKIKIEFLYNNKVKIIELPYKNVDRRRFSHFSKKDRIKTINYVEDETIDKLRNAFATNKQVKIAYNKYNEDFIDVRPSTVNETYVEKIIDKEIKNNTKDGIKVFFTAFLAVFVLLGLFILIVMFFSKLK